MGKEKKELTAEEREKLEKRLQVVNIALEKFFEQHPEPLQDNNAEITRRKLRIEELESQLDIQSRQLPAMQKKLNDMVNEETKTEFQKLISAKQDALDKMQKEINELKDLNSKEPAVLMAEQQSLYETLYPQNQNGLSITKPEVAQPKATPSQPTQQTPTPQEPQAPKQPPQKMLRDLSHKDIKKEIQKDLKKSNYKLKQEIKSGDEHKWLYTSKNGKENFEVTESQARTSHYSDENITAMMKVVYKGLDADAKSLKISGATPEAREKSEKILAKILAENNRNDISVNGKSVTDILNPKPAETQTSTTVVTPGAPPITPGQSEDSSPTMRR